jgi:hypothetical protein
MEAVLGFFRSPDQHINTSWLQASFRHIEFVGSVREKLPETESGRRLYSLGHAL